MAFGIQGFTSSPWPMRKLSLKVGYKSNYIEQNGNIVPWVGDMAKRDLHKQQPQLVTELATLTGRAVSNVSRTLKTLGKYNLVEMEKSPNGLAVKLQYQSMVLLIQPLE
ncbi:MarR family transcriptional regulator [Vibrio aestuarianus]|nr:MarR family transcriptional regulator [Vibrio aestuarianus]MDE1223711.1 MarR family transcriptional regulator [Vibrio aestuarianus]